MNKRMIRLLVMLAVLLVSVGVYVAVVLVNRSAQDDTAADQSIRLVDIDTTAVTGISWNYDGSDICLNKGGDGVWHWTEDETCPISTASVETLINAFSAVSATKAVTDAQGAAEYGLDTPTYEYTVTLVSGHKVSLSLGDYSSYAAGYYASVGTAGEVYIVGEDIISSFSVGIMDMLQLETAPDLSGATELTVTVDGKSLTLRYYADSSTMSYTDSYHWFVQRGQSSVAASTDKVTELLNSLNNINWSDCIAYDADTQLLASCGIGQEGSAEVTVIYQDAGGNGGAFTLLLGDYVDGSCYANIKGSTMLYTVTGASADRFILLTEEDVYATELCMVDTDKLMSITLQLDGETAVLDYAGEESATGPDGELVSVPVWQRGGEKLSSDAVTAFTDALTTMQIAQRTDNEYGRRELMRVALNLSSGEIIDLAFYTYSSTQVVAVRDGVTSLVSTADADALIGYARALLPAEG